MEKTVRLFSEVPSQGQEAVDTGCSRGNSGWISWIKLFIVRSIEHWKMYPEKLLENLSWKIFKIELSKAPVDLTLL